MRSDPPRVPIAGPPPHVRGDCRADARPRVQHPGGGAVHAGSALLAAARPARVGPAFHARHLGRGRLLLAADPSRVPAAGRGGGGGILPSGVRDHGLHHGRRRGRPSAGGRRAGVRRLLHPVGGGAGARPPAGAVGRRPGRHAGGRRRVPSRLDDALRPRPGSRREHRPPRTAGVHSRRRRRQPASRPGPRPGLLGAADGGRAAPARGSRHARSLRGLAGHGRTAGGADVARRRRGARGPGPGPASRRVGRDADRGLALRRPARQSPPSRPRSSPRGRAVPDCPRRDHGRLPPGRLQATWS